LFSIYLASPGIGTTQLITSWMKYIDFEIEQSKKNHKSIIILYERAIHDCFLCAELWIKYINYLQHYYRIPEFIMNIQKRATR
jgi:hypothetical protein